jgi:hypothetical protein
MLARWPSSEFPTGRHRPAMPDPPVRDAVTGRRALPAASYFGPRLQTLNRSDLASGHCQEGADATCAYPPRSFRSCFPAVGSAWASN